MVHSKSTIQERLNFEIDSFKQLLKLDGNEGVLEKKVKADIIKVLDTVPIRTLDSRYQLGLLYKISDGSHEWQDAKHSRLEHTIGVVAKCIVACDVINKTSKSTGYQFTETDVRELIVAAALHDCGHLPASHATERGFLTVKNLSKGISHEERIIPLIVNKNSYFEEIRNIVLSWDNFNEHSFYRIAYIISPEIGEEYRRKKVNNFVPPKKAIQQLLVSEIDLDRLDYILRDAEKLKYTPVTLISDQVVDYIRGISLVPYKTLKPVDLNDGINIELCLSEEKKDNVFYLLVARVLLYKYVYFSKKLRSFEAVLTYLIGTLIDKNIALEPLKLIGMSDDEFIRDYLTEVVGYIDDESLRNHLIKKYVNVLKKDKVERFHRLLSISDDDIENPRLREEFIKNVNDRRYIDNLKNYLYSKAPTDIEMERSDILLDVFQLKTGGGGLLVRLKGEGEKYKTLKEFMNGSNMHRLCSEIRLDIYIKSDANDKKKQFVIQEIESFFKKM